MKSNRKTQDARTTESDWRNFSKNPKDASGTPFSCAKRGDKNNNKSGWALVASLKRTELKHS